MTSASYPVHVDATLDPQMSRWLWLVKWFLAIPHYVVLAFLWVAFVVVSVLAFFTILFTGRYPRALFDFNVGVLRWSWRVSYYTYGALGTDRYPPFTLADVADYPAHLDIDYPTHLSRGLVLVKWWLLAIPHYLIVGIFVGGGTWALWRATDTAGGAPGLIGLLVLIAAIALAFTGRYPQQIFDFVLGMNRWAIRVGAYAGLMTDRYPPFRLDLGGHEAGGTMTVATKPTGPAGSAASTAPAESTELPVPPAPPQRSGWTAGRIVSLVMGSIFAVASLGVLAAGALALWATTSQRDASGYLTTGTHTFTAATYAVTSDGIDLGGSADLVTPGDVLGTVRIRATGADPSQAIFIGVAPEAKANAYLAGVSHVVVTDWAGKHSTTVLGRPQLAPGHPRIARIWTASTSGPGTQSLTWRPASGSWVIVIMNADGSPAVSVTADAGATVPDLDWIAGGLIAVGAILLTSAIVLIAVPVTRAGR
ncbi:MAG TPA: DUF4389 domain-containing protein [Jatrophihabitans sp.]